MSLKNKFKTFFSLEDEYEYVEEESEPEQREESLRKQENRNNVISLQAVQSSSKVVLCEPRSYSEVQEIADHIVNRRAVVINLQRVEYGEAKQIVDFLSGAVYAVSGKIEKLGSQTFLCTPENIDVSGTISDHMVEEELEKRW